LHYAPYSGEPGPIVLAAAELVSGTVGGGANIEIVNLSLTKHAEELAILSALANDTESPRRGRLSAVYVAGLQPCGSCRQFAAEFASEDAVWILEHISQRELRTTSLSTLPDDREPQVAPFGDLLPCSFLSFDEGASGSDLYHRSQ
jgi:cytidine deaminase